MTRIGCPTWLFAAVVISLVGLAPARAEAATAASPDDLVLTLPAAVDTLLSSDRGRAIDDVVDGYAADLDSADVHAAVPDAAVPDTGIPDAVTLSATGSLAHAAPATPPPATPPPATPPPVVPPAPPLTPPAPQGRVDCAVTACVALTFDDGPGPFTPTLLDELDAAGARATFFVLGQNAAAHPDVIGRMVRSGMTVANHTWDHRDMRRLADADAHAEVDRTQALLDSLGVPRTGLLRPPYGAYTQAARTLGQALVLWDVDTEDWRNRDSGVTTARALATARAGSIILMHDIHASTVAAVPGIVAQLRARGLTLVTVPELLGQLPACAVAYRRG